MLVNAVIGRLTGRQIRCTLLEIINWKISGSIAVNRRRWSMAALDRRHDDPIVENMDEYYALKYANESAHWWLLFDWSICYMLQRFVPSTHQTASLRPPHPPPPPHSIHSTTQLSFEYSHRFIHSIICIALISFEFVDDHQVISEISVDDGTLPRSTMLKCPKRLSFGVSGHERWSRQGISDRNCWLN